MRILFLAQRLPYPPDKGDKIRSFWELQALSARHTVDLFCFYDDAKDQEYIQELGRYCRHCYAEKLSLVRSRARAIAAMSFGRPFSLGFFYSPSMAQRIKEALQTRDYDLILVLSSQMAQYVESVFSLPRIIDMVDVDSDKWEQYAEHTLPPISWLWKYEARHLAEFESRIVEDFSMTVVCTESEAKILRSRRASHRICALPHPLDLTYFDPARVVVPQEIAKLQPYIIFSGSMSYFPNVDAVLQFYRKVLPRVRARLPGIRFVIAGRDPQYSIRRLAKDPGVHVTGWVPDMRPYLAGASAAVAPLRIARGLQNKLIEAMAMGIPVAASSVTAGALPQSLSSLLVVEDDPERLADQLVALLQQGCRVTVNTIRESVSREFGRARLGEELENILVRAQESHSNRIQILERRDTDESPAARNVPLHEVDEARFVGKSRD